MDTLMQVLGWSVLIATLFGILWLFVRLLGVALSSLTKHDD